jgi:hypothetical protein
MPREPKLERIDIPDECRTVKDWFTTRESADQAIPGIRAHILTTGQPHTWPGHTHTRPSRDAIPVYVGEFSLPEKYLKAKRFAPCPCCWDQFGKFGHGKIAWFPEERVVRLIGPDCFASLNPEAHAKAQSDYEIEQERKRNTEFLLANMARLPDVIRVVERAIVVAKAVETFHAELHGKLRIIKLNLWPYVRRDGELSVSVKEREFRRGSDGEMFAHEIDGTRVEAKLPGFKMLDPKIVPLSKPLETVLSRLRQVAELDKSNEDIEAIDDNEKRRIADTLSRNVKKTKEKIEELEDLRQFAKRVAINTLRHWGAHEGCPIPVVYSHNGDRIAVGHSAYSNVAIDVPKGMDSDIGTIDFWTNLERRRK